MLKAAGAHRRALRQRTWRSRMLVLAQPGHAASLTPSCLSQGKP